MSCSEPECGLKIRACGLCAKHYRRLGLYGSPEGGKFLSGGNVEDRLRFIGWIVTDTGCWEWNGSRRGTGYGRLFVSGRATATHRLAYETWVGPIPKGLLIRHKCDNPPCMNPTHLETGTHLDNAQDRESRTHSNKGSSNPNAKLSPEDVLGMRQEYGYGVLTQQMLAEIHGVTKDAIYKALHSHSWREI